MNIISLGSSVCAVGLQWRDGNPKTIRKEARAEAAHQAIGEDDVAVAYSYSENTDKSGATYGVGILKNKSAIKKQKRIYALAACFASRLEDGLYIAKLDGIDGAPVFWLLGVSRSLVLPQTDQVYESLDALQNNVAMLRTIMPDAAVYLHQSVREVFVVDEKEWSFPLDFPAKRDSTISWAGSSLGGSSLLVELAKLLALTAIIVTGGWFGWNYYQAGRVKEVSPEDLARQQAQMYETSLNAIAADYSAASLMYKWNHMTRALDSARLITSGVRLSHFHCDLSQCRAQFEDGGFGPIVREHAVAQMKGYLGAGAGVVVDPQSQPGNIILQWQLPSPSTQNVRGPEEIIEWSQNLPGRAKVEEALKATIREPLASLRPFVKINGEGGISVIRQTDPAPPGRIAVQVLQLSIRPVFPGYASLSVEIARMFGGLPAGLDVHFDNSGIPGAVVVQILSKVQS